MKRIINFPNTILLLGSLFILAFCVSVQAQGARLNPRKPVGQPVENAPTLTQDAPTQGPQNRPKAPVVNPRLQALVLDQFLPRISLTPEQTGKIRQLRLQHIRRMRALLDLERAHTKIYDEALFDPTVDQKEVEKRTTQLAEVRTDMLKAQAQFFLDLRQVLTVEQITKLRELMDEGRALRKNAP
ncbi:MAG TPA: Spy/CpxP family protein refolding chaperone [Blastocatellia bacterium]|nr:Spy/CpxP family protein refolding chaperone [Blastocatellia bacterium]